MKALCYLLVLNVVLSAADNLDAQNNSDEAKVETRKIKHTISRFYSLPHTLARSGHNRNYNQILKISQDPSLEQQQLSVIEASTELSDVGIDLSKNKIQDESTADNNLKENTRKLFYANKYTKRERDRDSIASNEETELNAETLNEILQNLKASNVSNLEQKQIRKGKLVIYYDSDQGLSGVPIEINHISKNKQLDVEKFMQIDDKLHNLFIQHQVPENIFYIAKRRAYIEPKERTKNLFTAFVKYMADKGQLNIEIIDELKNFIAHNNLDVNLEKLLLLKDSSHVETQSQTVEVTDVIKSVFDDAEQKTEQEIQRSTKGTLLDLPIINSLSHVRKHQKNDKVEEIADVVIPNSHILLRPKNEANTTKEKIIKIKTESKSGNTELNLNVSNNILQTAVKKNSNDENDFEVRKSGIQSIQIPDLTNYYKNKDRKIILSEDALNPIVSPLMQNLIRNCDQNDCEAIKNLHTFDLDALKMISKGAISDVVPYLQEVDSSVPVLSNIPVEEYLNYNNRKPFFIYVMFSDPEKNSELSDNPTKIDPHFTLPDIETIINNYYEKFNEGYNTSSILQIIKKAIENRTGPHYSTKIHSAEDILDIINNPKESINSDTSHGPSKNEIIDEIFDNLLNNKKDKTELYPENQLLYILNNLTHIIDNNEVENNIRIEDILSLLPDITTEPEYYPAREGSEKNLIERIKRLFLSPEKYSPEQIPDVEELKKITNDPHSLKIIIQLILQDISSIKKMKLKIENDSEKLDQSTEKLIQQIKYLRKVLVKLNIPQQGQINIIRKEIEKGILKIITERVSYCTNKVKRNLELSIQKALINN